MNTRGKRPNVDLHCSCVQFDLNWCSSLFGSIFTGLWEVLDLQYSISLYTYLTGHRLLTPPSQKNINHSTATKGGVKCPVNGQLNCCLIFFVFVFFKHPHLILFPNSMLTVKEHCNQALRRGLCCRCQQLLLESFYRLSFSSHLLFLGAKDMAFIS